jgi:hypothetical protein
MRAPPQRVATDPCSRSSSPLDLTLFVAVGIQSRKHMFASTGEGGGDAVTDCHGLSRGMALADWQGLGRRPWWPQRAGEDLGGRSPSPTCTVHNFTFCLQKHLPWWYGRKGIDS